MPLREIKATRWILLLALALLGIAAVRDVVRLGDQLPWRQMGDFTDFYCAGVALDQGQSPYTYEPLHACEHRIAQSSLLRQNPALVIPAPQPPYDFPPFMFLARFGFSLASAMYALAIVLAMLGSAGVMARMGIPFDLAIVGFALPISYEEMAAGQMVPFALLGLTLSGAALAFRRDALAGALAALVAIEPQFGAPVAATVFLYVPRARAALVSTAILMAVVGIWTVTPAGFVDYFRRTLPAHTGSEVDWPFQYSLTYAVHYLGMPAGIAQILGTISYFAAFAFALWLAPRLVAAFRRREMFAFVPAMCAVVGGPFIHAVEMPAAIPAVLVFASDLRGTLRAASGAALCLLIVPWIKVWAVKKLFAASILLCAVVLLRLGLNPPIVIAILSGLAALIYSFELMPPNVPPAVPALHYSATDLASDAWKRFTPNFKTRDFAWFAIKIPTWTALVAALGIAVACTRRLHQPADTFAAGPPSTSRRI